MNKKALTLSLSLSLLLASSPAIMADEFYTNESTNTTIHHEVSSGGIGLVVGSLAAGPIGAIIGGSMGVLVGDQQTKSLLISNQQKAIQQLEIELDGALADFAMADRTIQQSQKKINLFIEEQVQTQQQHRAEIMMIAASYQLDIYFTTNSSLIQQQAHYGLNKLATLLENNPHIHANIEAHSDWRGNNDDNCRLANNRLAAVSNILKTGGSPAEQLLATNYGEQANINHGSWGEELFYDRRVSITLSYFE